MAVCVILDLGFEGISSIITKAERTVDGTGYLARARNPRSPEVLVAEV